MLAIPITFKRLNDWSGQFSPHQTSSLSRWVACLITVKQPTSSALTNIQNTNTTGIRGIGVYVIRWICIHLHTFIRTRCGIWQGITIPLHFAHQFPVNICHLLEFAKRYFQWCVGKYEWSGEGELCWESLKIEINFPICWVKRYLHWFMKDMGVFSLTPFIVEVFFVIFLHYALMIFETASKA